VNGIYADGVVGETAVHDASISDSGTATVGIGLWAIAVPIRAERIFVRRHRGMGLQVLAIDTATCALSDLDIGEGLGSAPGRWIENRTRAHVSRARVEDSRGGGLYIVGGAVVDARDVVLRKNDLFGATVGGASTLTVTRGIFAENKRYGLYTRV